jgi:phosphoglycolate phosphatase-like HAD superfamily hydrolase
MPLFLQLQDILTRHPELKAPVFSAVDSYEMRAASLAEPKAGAMDLLGSLSASAKLGMVTLQGRLICDDVSRRFKLKDVFRTQITREVSLDRAEQLRLALGAMGSSTQATLFVGDMPNDVACARRTGVDVVIMGSRFAADQKPDHSFLSFAELRAFLA